MQDAVDQAIKCAGYLGDPTVTLRCKDRRAVPLTNTPVGIFPISVVADHFPALTFQARQFLQVDVSEPVLPPLVIDVFGLDAMTEILESPLRLLSYLSLRDEFGDQLIGSHEHTFLSYHLKRNLWVTDDTDMLGLEDNVSADLDLAMAVRRDRMPGVRTPDGILTRFAGIITAIEDEPHAVAIDLRLMLLTLSEETTKKINRLTDEVLQRTAADCRLHDVSFGIATGSCGLTIHCSRLAHRAAEMRLMEHCKMRKYAQKADFWFGIALMPDGSLRFAGKLVSEWRFDPDMERLLVDWKSRQLKMDGAERSDAISPVRVEAAENTSGAAFLSRRMGRGSKCGIPSPPSGATGGGKKKQSQRHPRCPLRCRSRTPRVRFARSLSSNHGVHE